MRNIGAGMKHELAAGRLILLALGVVATAVRALDL
jgi:hypothetical protein